MAVTRTPTAPSSAVDVRRWIRQRRIATTGRVEPGTVYSVGLALAMAFALIGQPVLAAIWPARAGSDPVTVLPVVAAGVGLMLYFGILRQLGPLSISRGDAGWLLPAAVSRRRLLSPALGLAAITAAGVGGLAGLSVTARIAARPASVIAVLTGLTTGVAVAMVVMLVAVGVQRRPAWGRRADLVAGGIAGTLALLAVVGQAVDAGRLPLPVARWQPGLAQLSLAALGAIAAIGATLLVRRSLERWPAHQIAAAAAVTGGYADALYALEPSFLAEQSARRYWQRRPAFRSTGWFRRKLLPPLVTQDLLVVRRRATRCWWLAGTALLPALLAGAPRWLLIPLLLIGALGAAGMTTESTHRDARDPAMLRLLGLSGRQALAQRLVVPGAIASVWCAVAFAGLQAGGGLAGPWWVLGVVAGPAVAVAALQRARASASSIGQIFIDTPLGAFPSGMLLWLLNGVDVLAVLTLPLTIALAMTGPNWYALLGQAVASAVGCGLLIRWAGARAGQLRG